MRKIIAVGDDRVDRDIKPTTGDVFDCLADIVKNENYSERVQNSSSSSSMEHGYDKEFVMVYDELKLPSESDNFLSVKRYLNMMKYVGFGDSVCRVQEKRRKEELLRQQKDEKELQYLLKLFKNENSTNSPNTDRDQSDGDKSVDSFVSNNSIIENNNKPNNSDTNEIVSNNEIENKENENKEKMDALNKKFLTRSKSKSCTSVIESSNSESHSESSAIQALVNGNAETSKGTDTNIPSDMNYNLDGQCCVKVIFCDDGESNDDSKSNNTDNTDNNNNNNNNNNTDSNDNDNDNDNDNNNNNNNNSNNNNNNDNDKDDSNNNNNNNNVENIHEPDLATQLGGPIYTLDDLDEEDFQKEQEELKYCANLLLDKCEHGVKITRQEW
eukprot:Pgem_evm1s19558